MIGSCCGVPKCVAEVVGRVCVNGGLPRVLFGRASGEGDGVCSNGNPGACGGRGL